MKNNNIFRQRRERFLEFLKLHHGVAIVAANPLAHRNDDVHYSFRQDSNFYYLTGLNEPEAILILHPGKAGAESTLFLRPKNPELETWEGRRLGLEAAPSILGIDQAYAIDEFEKRALDILPKLHTLYIDFTRSIPLASGVELLEYLRLKFDQLRRQSHRTHGMRLTGILDLQEALAHQRMIKLPEELEFIRKAQQINERAHRLAMAYTKDGCFEYQIEGLMCGLYRHHGADGVAYPPIVASGPNALILHHVENKRQMRDGDLCLIDAGPEVDYYASDITRTYPVSGRFQSAQKAIYEVVLSAQLEVEKNALAGKRLKDLHDISVRKLVEGLVALKVLKGSVDKEIESKNFRKYFMHGNGHFLGLDVHDVELSDVLAPGHVITNEPGLYIPSDDLTCPEEFRGIGVRIEDDLHITDGACENLSAGIPKTIVQVEEACRQNWRDLWGQWVN